MKVDFSTLKEDVKEYIPPTEEAPDYWECPSLLTNEEKEPFVLGVFITHAHFDHVQDISFLDPKIPIYSSEKTHSMLEIITEVSGSKIENEFAKYYNYYLSSKSINFRNAFPYSLKIDKKGSYENKKFIFNDPELALELQVENFPQKRLFNNIDDKEIVSLDSFLIKAISVSHSIPGALSYLVTETITQKRILYSGDFRFGGVTSPNLKQFIEEIKRNGEELDAFICEGTRIGLDKIKTDTDIEKNILEKMKEIEKLILIDFNWKDLERLKIILNCCKKIGRKLLISPKTAYLLFHFYQKFPDEYMNPITEENLGVYIKRRENLLYSPEDYDDHDLGFFNYWGTNSRQDNQNIIRIKHMLDYLESKNDENKGQYIKELGIKHKKYLEALENLFKDWFGDIEEKELIQKLNIIWELATYHLKKGIKAYEVRSSPEKYVLMFSFWDVNELFDLSSEDRDMSGSYFIKANTEPFNDEMLIDEQKMMNWLYHFKVKYDYKLRSDTTTNGLQKKEFLREHASGHISGLELKEIISKLNPKIIIPIHTQRMDKFEEFGNELGVKIVIPEYGKSIKI